MLLIQRPPVRGVVSGFDYSLLFTRSCYCSIHTYSMIFPFLFLLSSRFYIWDWERNFSGYFCGLREEWSFNRKIPSPPSNNAISGRGWPVLITWNSKHSGQLISTTSNGGSTFWGTMDYCNWRLFGDGISETFPLSRLLKLLHHITGRPGQYNQTLELICQFFWPFTRSHSREIQPIIIIAQEDSFRVYDLEINHKFGHNSGLNHNRKI